MKISGRRAADIAASLERHIHGAPATRADVLPPVRELAARLRVSPATVAAAYKLLRTRGLVTGQGRRGTRIARGGAPVAMTATVAAPSGVDLASGNPDPALLPPVAAVISSLRVPGILYGDPPEDPGLVAFAAGEFEADGVPATSTATLSGTLEALDCLLRDSVRPGDSVALEDPGYPPVTELVLAFGCTPVPMALDADGPSVPAVQAAVGAGCRAIIITTRAQNPTGAALSPRRAAELERVLRGFTGIVIETDPAGPVAGVPAVTMARTTERWAVVRSCSKFLGPDLRVAIVASDSITIARVRRRQALGPRWVSHLLQRLVLALWSDPSGGRRIARASETYTRRRVALEAALAHHGIAARAASGFNLWVPCRDELSIVRALERRGWAVAAGERFRIQSPPGIRITAAALDPADAEAFAADLAAVVHPPRTIITA